MYLCLDIFDRKVKLEGIDILFENYCKERNLSLDFSKKGDKYLAEKTEMIYTCFCSKYLKLKEK